MQYNPKILGSYKSSLPLIINHDTVYLHFNIQEIEIENPLGDEPYHLYQYDEIVMTKDEYIQFLYNQINANKKENNLQASAIQDYILNDSINVDFLVNQLHAGQLSFDDIPANIYNEVQEAYSNKVYHIEYPSIGLDI